MSIRQKRTMTEKSLEAHRRNARQSRGPVTAEGKKRLRDANISHGFYAQDGGAALVVLGEDPREYQALAEAVAEKWQPADAYEEQLSTQLVRALWRTRRSDRMQEGLALRLAQEAERWRQDNLHARLTKLRLNAACLRSLGPGGGAAGLRHHSRRRGNAEVVSGGWRVEGHGNGHHGPAHRASAPGRSWTLLPKSGTGTIFPISNNARKIIMPENKSEIWCAPSFQGGRDRRFLVFAGWCSSLRPMLATTGLASSTEKPGNEVTVPVLPSPSSPVLHKDVRHAGPSQKTPIELVYFHCG